MDAAGILDLLTSLVDKSLVIAEPRGGETRYRLLDDAFEAAQAEGRAMTLEQAVEYALAASDE